MDGVFEYNDSCDTVERCGLICNIAAVFCEHADSHFRIRNG